MLINNSTFVIFSLLRFYPSFLLNKVLCQCDWAFLCYPATFFSEDWCPPLPHLLLDTAVSFLYRGFSVGGKVWLVSFVQSSAESLPLLSTLQIGKRKKKKKVSYWSLSERRIYPSLSEIYVIPSTSGEKVSYVKKSVLNDLSKTIYQSQVKGIGSRDEYIL